MASVKPFCGLRPAKDSAERVVSLPYDVMDTKEARQMIAANKDSFLRVTRAEAELDAGIDPHAPEVYAKAASNMKEFIATGLLVPDAQPCFYVYKQQMDNHKQVGLVVAASVEEYKNNIIKKHELTRPDKEQDRVNHILATEAQTGAIFLTYRASETVNALMAQAMAQTPAHEFTTEDGIVHTLYVVSEPERIRAIEEAFGRIETLYIADGHHRAAAAARVYDKCRSENPNHTGEEPYNRFLAVLFPHNMMKILDYNRVVKDLNGLSQTAFLEQVQEKFEIHPCSRKDCRAEYPHYFGMYLDKAWYKLVAKADSYDEANPLQRLDVSILQENLLKPILGIENPRTDKRIGFVGGIRGIKELERLVDQGEYQVAFSLYPTSIKALMEISDANLIMPPKSTWFEPKLRDAMVVHMTPCRFTDQ
ncbi:DUF1015 domain-containing protein [Azotosporobacter soli]|uniref:DUF1015 domain-containing protein n=1 Tax=Azotosporobacter soli TaxID=3055040 RepID=UPI0031FF13F8